MKKRNYILVCLIVLLHATTALAGGPWPQPAGGGYFKLSEWWILFDQHYTDAGELDPNVTSGIYNTALYGEYGFTDQITGILYAPLFSRNLMYNQVSATTGEIITRGEALNAMGDIDVGLRYGLTKKDARVPVALSLVLGLPTGKTGGGSQGNLQTGDGEFNQLLQAEVGTSFSIAEGLTGYTSGYAGFNHRTRGFSEEIRYGIEAGLGLFGQRLWLIGRLTGVESLKNGETAATVNSTSIFANNTEFTAWSAELNVYILQRWGVSVSYASVFRGEIIAAAPSYSVGVFFDLSR